MMAGLEPGLEPLRCERDCVRSGDADSIEAERLGAFDDSLLQSVAV
jgi:hypothetical protein